MSPTRALVALVTLVVALAGIAPAVQPASAAPPRATVQPNVVNELDCNGWSAEYRPVVPAMRMRCVDPIGSPANGWHGKFYDNGHYVGHDEPSTKFISSAPGSGNTMTYFTQLSTDPSGTPTTTPGGTTVSDYAELSPAPWFGLPICDPNSFPGGACTPDSDSNTTAAGDAFMELQFYPPGFGPWLDSVSMDQTHWVAALNIDSLECPGTATTGCTTPSPNCPEPVNFAILTTDGVPPGPPSPQDATVATFTTNAQTLLMNPGDTLRVSISEVPDTGSSPETGGLETRVDDLTTGQSGFIVASAANGFMNTDEKTCGGAPFSFHAEYDTAKQQNQVGWAALEGGVLMEDEIGHFEPCSTLSNADSVSSSGFADPNVEQTCNGPFEAQDSAPGTGEGPCTGKHPTTGPCTGATTEGSTYTTCSVLDSSCEQSDGWCIPSGSRTVTISGRVQTWSQPIAGCGDNQFQNGDLDFDGSSYIADWPDGSTDHPTSFRYLGPFDPSGNEYTQVQFETDAPGSENNCDPSAPTPTTCAVPPQGATFYPFWSMTDTQGLNGLTTEASSACVWNFGNDISGGITTNDFGGDTQYGSASTHYGGTLISAPTTNPTTLSPCGHITEDEVSPPGFQTVSAVSTKQFTLSGSDGSTWTPLGCGVVGEACSGAGTGNNLSFTLTPNHDGIALLSGNSDLWTASAGYNQDIGIAVSGGAYPTSSGQPEAWKESGGSAGTFSPNAAFVQAAIPVVHGVMYDVTLVWKTSISATGSHASILAGAGPLNGVYSPTRLSAVVLLSPQVGSAVSTKQFELAGNNGVDWQTMTCAGETSCSTTGSGTPAVSFTPAHDGELLLSGNSDLWTAKSGYNQDLGIFVSGGVYPTAANQPEAWKESGGGAGTFSPNAALVQTVIPVSQGVTYKISLGWKASRSENGASIDAGAGNGVFSPTSLVATLFPAGSNPHSVASTQQYFLANSDGSTWQPMTCAASTSCLPSESDGNLSLSVTPAQTCTVLLTANADLWTENSGFNQDIALFVNGNLVAWKESGGSAGTFSPNAAFLQTEVTLTGPATSTIDVRWKTSKPGSGSTIAAGAGPVAGTFSPSRLTATLTYCS